MRKGIRFFLVLGMTAGAFSNISLGQSPAINGATAEASAYDVNRETALTGTVQFFTPAAQIPPLGAHLTLKTSGGVVDVHLGDARFLTANHFSIENGDSVRIIGETVAYGKGTQFVARLVQKGTQVLAVRSIRGTPLSYMAPHDREQTKSQAGSL